MSTTAIPTHETVRLTARTREIEDAPDLLALLPSAQGVHSWVRHGEGIVGWGEAARIETSGPRRFDHAERAWRRLVSEMDVEDEVGEPGCGPVAFGSFAFADHPGRSVLSVPSVLMGRKSGRTWITTIHGADAPSFRAHTPVAVPGSVRWLDSGFPVSRWRDAVAEAVRRMRGGALEKVVLARDLVAEADRPIDPRFLLLRLAQRHPECWTFAVDGLVGATPELLLRRRKGQVSARVLAGSTWPGANDDEYLLRSAALREEHRFAVDSLLASLGPWCTSIHTDGPFVLSLRTIAHLATDVTGTLPVSLPASLLRLAEAVHPTAAVGGAPRGEAVRQITELEGLDRGRYAGPVGWVDAAGDGELGIALRCAQLTGRRARLFAGCGVISQSDPDVEVAETHAKFAAMREALDV